MKFSIGIITATKSMSNIQQIDEYMRQKCDITYLPYSTNMELANIYLENANKFDGFLFSGSFPYDYITNNVCRITKPTGYMELVDRDIYLFIARTYAHDPSIDFTRVLFDGFTKENMENWKNPSVFEDIFPIGRLPAEAPFLNMKFYYNNIATMYDAAMEVYREKWKSGNYDLFVTRLTNLADRLKAENIPYILLQPCVATMRDCFDGLLSDIQASKFENSLAACCAIQIAHENPTDEEYVILKKALDDFNSRQNMCFVIRPNGDYYDLVTSGNSARELTNDYISCLLTSFLLETLPFHTFIGWGIDFDVVTSHQKAVRAIKESNVDPHRYTYVVNENDEIIGPLGGEKRIVYQMNPSSRITNLAKTLGISAMNLEKLISLQTKKNITSFSASDLVYYLDITPRSATRILKKLVESGAAEQIDSVHLSNRGRPSAVYKINLDNIK